MSSTDLLVDDSKLFSIVIVNYKTPEITKICLDLLRKHVGGSNVPIWVVDNYSADESTEYLRTLDWINLIERTAPEPEPGHIAHGKALDMVLERIETDYLFLMHTDTFVFDKNVFSMMLNKCIKNPKVVAVGCVEQLNRGAARTLWRFSSRLFKHHFRHLKVSLGLRSREPKPYKEVYLKSFCTLWNCKLVKQHGMHFSMDDRVPGYTLQDRMTELGYVIEMLSPRKIFSYLDHIQAGTVAAAGGYGETHRRTNMYNNILKRMNKKDSNS
ncbi:MULTISPECIES: glycosyltransferase [unclassified Pseudomonas]|uniref:glycosyltransferase n=1 Tax=unclassified Pseudomonas TaxID=196821 RepID=UPI0011ED97AA|nr:MULTISPECIES: glycosyltransferase [unclassified Pseudomonas]KAA0943820.1 glycosyltransferase [Pseudomonas sp. ANT_H4]KAA0950722.1 glycosyltransferase [Pseudomonas sp. ANT_H14]